MPVAKTSIEAYHSAIKGKKENVQDKAVLEAVRKLQPCTGSQVKKETGLEVNLVSRSMNNLKNGKGYNGKPQIEEYFEAKCKITGFKAKHYIIPVDTNQVKINFK